MSIRDASESPPSGWIEALHEAIASNSEADFHHPQADALPRDQVDKMRDCLWLLEHARRGQQDGDGAPRCIGRFEIVREVGRGGFGIVFLAIDPRMGRRVALKVPRPEVLMGAAARGASCARPKPPARWRIPT